MPPPPPKRTLLHLGVSQSHALPTLSQTLQALERTARRAASLSLDLVLFPEAYLGGYPRTATFGASVGGRTAAGREQFRRYFRGAVDLGDTPRGAGERWRRRELEAPRGGGERGDGTREELERVARETGVFLVVGCVERAGGSLYCAVVYVCPREGCLGKRRKVMPTGSERLIWAQGQASTLRAVTTTIRGVRLTLAAAICWENYMPLLRQALYAQDVNLYLAPTADARETWEPLMRTVACEGRCFVLSANQCGRREDLPGWLRGEEEEEEEGEGVEGGEKGEEREMHMGGEKGRRVSIIDDGNEIVLPSSSPRQANGHAQADGGGGGGEVSAQRRRVSIMEDGNEIVLPACAEGTTTTTTARERRRVSIIDDGNEIVLPSPKDPNGYGYGDGPSPSPRSSQPPHPPQSKQTTSSTSSSPFLSRGGSCIVSPSGEVLAGPAWEQTDALLHVAVDLEDCARGRLDLDVAGHYARGDAFRLEVEGLELDPPV